MVRIITQSATPREDWLQQLADVITDPMELLRRLDLASDPSLLAGINANRLFSLRVPHAFVARMRPRDPQDPLLRQVITLSQEWQQVQGFSPDPLGEQNTAVPGLLHKYHNRALLLVKNSCAINCRYCFRRHFPYQEHPGNKRTWQQAIDYITQHRELDEILFSGGDPLMAKDHELSWLIGKLENIPHIRRLRIHTRLPIVIPSRITPELCQRFVASRLQILLVTHINHANEIDQAVSHSMSLLRQAGVTLLNQSVLLRGVNDNANTLAELSHALFDAGILPYYLHLLDKVQGAAHFLVGDNEARRLVKELLSKVSGYLVPKLTREIAGQASKTPLDLHLP